MYKKLGLTSEEVCEVGKWKNVNAFTAHYSRLGASTRASGKILELVHNVSPMQRAESDWSRTPWKNDKGGMDQEDEAQSIGEPTLPPLMLSETYIPNDSDASGMTPFLAPSSSFLENSVHISNSGIAPSFLDSELSSSDMAFRSTAFNASMPLPPIMRTRKNYKRTRDTGDSPPKKFQFAPSKKGKEKED